MPSAPFDVTREAAHGTADTPPPESSRTWWQRLLVSARPVPLVLALAWLVQPSAAIPERAAKEPQLGAALAHALKHHGLDVDVSSIHWLDPPAGLLTSRYRRPRALLRAHEQGEPFDIYRVDVKLSPEGRLLDLAGIYNITDTSAADESQLVVSGDRAAWTIGGGNKVYSVHFADLRGEAEPDGDAWSTLKRAQHALTNLQNTGDSRGIGRRSFRLDPVADEVVLGFSSDKLIIDADARQIRIWTDGNDRIDGRRFVEENEHHLAPPGNLVTWTVDRVRALPWFGQDRMQVLKAIGFKGLDTLQRFVGSVTGADGSEEVKEELGGLLQAAPIKYTDPATGWPPPPMKPILSKPIEGEGQWVSLENDPFVRSSPNTPSPFVFSFIRSDRKRAYLHTYVVLWDPRQVELHPVSGTVEPKSATGETGDGLVPRKPEVMGRLVAAFNGGFQATHGEYGMGAERVVYLPPKPFAATVAKLDDGSTAFGTWPNDDAVPDHVVSYRQNMTPLIQDGEVNPYKRHWWGGVPPGWTEESRTVRSAICMTKEKFIAYIYGAGLDATQLRLASEAARCDYVIHLDMNPGHVGLEFYHAAPKGELPEVGHDLNDDWEKRGAVSGMPGWEYLGRRMIKHMALMNFPRYIRRESRDFFYLTLRHVLPGPDLPEQLDPEDGRGWRVSGLPQFGWPYAMARATVKPDESRPDTKVRLLKLDARMLEPGKPHDTERLVVSVEGGEPSTPRGAGSQSVWWTQTGFVIDSDSPGKTARRLADGYDAKSVGSRAMVAALGVDAGQMAVYAEVATERRAGGDQALLTDLMRQLGCTQFVLFDEAPRWLVGGARDLSGRPATPGTRALRLARGEGPGAKRFFEDTPIVEPDVWSPLQRKRIRYFREKKEEPTESAAGEGAPEPNGSETQPEAAPNGASSTAPHGSAGGNDSSAAGPKAALPKKDVAANP